MTSGFDSHLMLHCYGCSRQKLSDNKALFDFLSNLPHKINLKNGNSPHVFSCSSEQPSEETGVSGIMIGENNHITVHTFPDKGHVFIDIFSAREFDVGVAADQIIKLFEPKDHEIELGNARSDFVRKVPAGAHPSGHHIFGDARSSAFDLE